MGRSTVTRNGGHLVVDSLEALGAEVAVGLPGIHALPIWEAMRTSPIRDVPFRTELAAGFAADGYARVSGRPVPLLLSTGPGALISLAALMEAASSHVPVVAVCSQIPGELVGKGRGYLHELPDQLASFAPVVKWARRATSADGLPELIAEAWRASLTPPSGPVFLEVPTDLLAALTDVEVAGLDASPPPPAVPGDGELAEAARLLDGAARPAIWAGGGVIRSAAWEALVGLAEQLDAPVATTYMGKGAIPEDHPLSVGSACDEGAMLELLETADVVLAVGTELGAETTHQYRLQFPGRLIHLDAAPERIGATYPALGLVGDAGATLEALRLRVGHHDRDGSVRAAAVRDRIGPGLHERGHDELELELLRTIRSSLPRDAVGCWDMTILAYNAAAYFPALSPRRFLYPLGSGTLGYAWPAALGAKLALPGTPALAVHGDGGVAYGLQELATARQHGLDAKLLLVDDGSYGILREYQEQAFGAAHAVDLVQPDFASLAGAFGVPAREVEPDSLGPALEWALGVEGPAVVVLRTRLHWINPLP